MQVKSLCVVLSLFAASVSMAAGAAKVPASAVKAAPGQVWVNTDSKIYHCQGSQHFGKTKQGEYMQQTDAKAKGFKPAAGKECK